VESTLKSLGFQLESEQPHVSGERFLMQKDKQVLVATDSEGRKVIVKVSSKSGGKDEILHEKRARDLLGSVVFSNDNILFPKELYFGEKDGYMIWATEFIPQEKVFVAHDIEEQFFLILRAFEEQEAFHATTFEHLKTIDKFFPVFHAREYFAEFEKFITNIEMLNISEIDKTLNLSLETLKANKKTIDTYSNYLTHTDFVPHNFRIKDKTIYMLDLSAIHFGNKYEGWARFLNYMVIHNPKLENLLSNYVRDNRGAEEYLNLRLMRIYKLGFLIDFYVKSLGKTEGDLKELTLERIHFWHEILKLVLEDQGIPESFVEEYKKKRDNLRSEEEKKRQREFAVA
jgi:hypothetical protein